ncbi:hypothetical protein [Mesorhizobium sp. INR15]|uniref:hypothetical protein n=1 Tax=Mesorhizobium sp. INR15 TaxID=2654248 RepID=UPI0018966F13|nr:hypothetical protein [Mesorhizobium sp. INR15]QPC93821.1 hypothetical protein GA829_26335 [Mesorhizobium sp. INR15]
MKKLLLASLALTLMASSAFAQADAPPPPPAPIGATAPGDAPPPPPPPGPDGMRDHRGPPHGREAGPPPPPPSKAAHFRLKRGDVEIDAKCADDETMKACADTVSQLIEKFGTLSR